MIATKMMRRDPTDDGDSDSVSSKSEGGIHGRELMSRASQIFTGFGKGVGLLNSQYGNNDQGPQRNDLQARYLEASQKNLVSGRASHTFSDADAFSDDNFSLSDASTFEMPVVDGGGGVDDDAGTGGTGLSNDNEADIDRLQLEIQTPCVTLPEQRMRRAMSGMTLDSAASRSIDSIAESDNSEGAGARPSLLGPLPFFNKGRGDPVNKSNRSLKLFEDPNNKSNRKDSTGSSGSGNRPSSSWIFKSFKQPMDKDIEEDQNSEDVAKEQKLKAATKLMHKNFQTANNPESFRELQKKMKEQGALTGSSVRALLHSTVSSAELITSSSNDEGEDEMGLDFDRTAKDNFFTAAAATSRPASSGAVTDCTYGESITSDADSKQQELEQRLQNDPLFGSIDPRPYIHLPSREPCLQFLINVILCSTDEGRTPLLTLHGNKYLGKSKLIDAVLNNVQEQSQNSFTVLRSERSSNTTIISFYPFREIVSSALRECDKRTSMFGEQSNDEIDAAAVKESDSTVVQRLVQRKILDKSDQLMLSRILPDVMLTSRDLLSLLEGRSPAAITKDTADTFFKLLIPLQPVLLVLDSVDGDGGLDASSWGLLEQLILSSPTSCPQMIPILLSRQPLTIPQRLTNLTVETSLSALNRADSEEYIRCVFDPDCVDKGMRVDDDVLGIIHGRANGCPLFLERLVLWAQGREIVEIDETRNAIAINNSHGQELSDLLPVTLFEEVLSEINKLPHTELDSLKVACCMGMTFSPSTYEALCSEGLFDVLRTLMSSHRIFGINHDESFKWRNSVVFDAVSSIIITDEQQELHERICDSFGRITSTNCDVQQAKHYSITHRLNEAWDRYMDAGKQSEKIFDYTHAVTCYNQAKLSLRKRSSLRAKIACSTCLGWCLQALERYDDAEKELESSLEWTMSLPENDRHEEYLLLTALAKAKAFRSKYGEAIELYERALPIVDINAHSPRWLAHHISSYGEILRESGELYRAKELHEEALQYREMAVDDKSGTILELAISYTQLGCVHSALHDYEKASHYHKKALSARVSHLDFYSALVSESLNYCADALQAIGCGKEALPLTYHAVKIRKQLFGNSHPAYAHALSVLASTFMSIERPLESLEIMKECIDICDKAFPSNHSNLIPNLMLYGKVLRVSRDMVNSLTVYKRALFIHMINFRASQNEMQLKELNRCIRELESSPASRIEIIPNMPIPSVDPNKTNIILCSNFHRSSDEYALCVLSSLRSMGTINLIAVVAMGKPQNDRVQFARDSLDSLLLSEVPVAFSKTMTTAMKSHGASQISPYVNKDGVEMITSALTESPIEKSITIMCDACAADIADVMIKHPALFSEKVKAVVIMGSVQPVRRRSNIEPLATDDDDYDNSISQVYAGCQQFNIPTISVCEDVARGFPFPSSFVDNLTQTNHTISFEVQRKEEALARRLWEEGSKDSRKYIFGHEKLKVGQHSMWPLVKSINMELILGLLACIPMYRDAHFRWDKHVVNGIEHKICRHQNTKAGIIKSQSLSDEILMLVGFSLRTALLNTSC